MKKRLGTMLAGAIIVASLGSYASADNEANCASGEVLYLFSGTDAGVARRGLNGGAAGCLTANSDLVPYVDTQYLVPGSTHVIPAVGSRTLAQGPPTGGVVTLADGSTVTVSWHFATEPSTNRWEGQSIPIGEGTGTVTLTALGRSVSYEKVV